MKGRAKVRAAEPDEQETEPAAELDATRPDEEPETEPAAAPDGTPTNVPPKPEPKAEPKPPAKAPSRILADITREEDKSLRDWLEGIGEQGSFQVSLVRIKPEMYRDPVTGEETQVDGHLHTYDSAITEDQISRDWGGGTFSLKVKKRNEQGSFLFARGFHRTVKIAGDPKPKRHTQPPPPQMPSTAPPAENASVVKTAMEMVSAAYERNQGAPRGMDQATQMLIEQMREQNERQAAEMLEMRRLVATVQNQKPPEDPLKDRILGSLIDGESGRIAGLQARQESELRQLKESHAADIRRLEDRHDRVLADIRAQGDRQVDMMRQGYEREIAALRASHDVTMASMKSTQEVQVHTLKADITRLERDNAELRADVRELREKKDKGPLELLKDAKALKEAISDGDDGASERSTISQVVEAATSPAVMEGIGKFFSGRGPAPAATVQAQAVPVAPQRPVIVRDRATGGTFVQTVTAQGQVQMVPVKKKPRVITTDAGQQVEAPPMEPGDVKQLVAYLESAYSGGQDAQVLAQSTRSMVPEPIIAWIKENTTADSNGVDLFMRKVANLPSSSPLATQAGKNWLRKVGKALIGDTDE